MAKEPEEQEEPTVELDPKDVPKPKEVEGPLKIDKEKSEGIGSRMKDLEDKLNLLVPTKVKKVKKKSFKLPSKVKATTKNVKKMMQLNKVQVIYLKEGGVMLPTIGTYKDGKIIVGENIHNAEDDVFWGWMGGKHPVPTAMIPEWDIQPITRRTLKESTEQLKTWIHPQNIILRSIEAREALDKLKGAKFSGKTILFIVLGGIALAYILFSGQ